MIRRKYKKRKNPYVIFEYLNSLAFAITFGLQSELAKALIYYNQGEYCNDCDKESDFCECEKCSDCGYQRCLCNLNVNTSKKVINYSWNLAKRTLNDKELIKLSEIIYSLVEISPDSKYLLKTNPINKIIKFTKFWVNIIIPEDDYIKELRKIN